MLRVKGLFQEHDKNGFRQFQRMYKMDDYLKGTALDPHSESCCKELGALFSPSNLEICNSATTPPSTLRPLHMISVPSPFPLSFALPLSLNAHQRTKTKKRPGNEASTNPPV